MMGLAARLTGSLVVCILLLDGRSLAYDLMTTARLTGDWGGRRSALDAHGLNLDVVYTGDVVANVRGGVTHQTNYLDNVDLTLTCRLVELTGRDLGSLFFYGLSNHGGNPSQAVGDIQGVDNIEAPEGTQLYEAWWQKTVLSNRLSALVGLYDVSSEFDVISSAAVFLNSSFGTGAELSHSGRNGPSIFPATALAARFKAAPAPHFTLQAAVTEGVPAGAPAAPGRKFSLYADHGAFLIGEAAYYWGQPSSSEGATLLRVQRRRVGRGWGERPYALKVALGVWGGIPRRCRPPTIPAARARGAAIPASICSRSTMPRRSTRSRRVGWQSSSDWGGRMMRCNRSPAIRVADWRTPACSRDDRTTEQASVWPWRISVLQLSTPAPAGRC
jgi:Carbohydrate-selective porin, OprB family